MRTWNLPGITTRFKITAREFGSVPDSVVQATCREDINGRTARNCTSFTALIPVNGYSGCAVSALS
jgi:hypothetical protein